MRLSPGWADVVRARLDERLSAHAPHPIALALSGGGDSMALLHLLAEWSRERGRRVLALTVDHRLNADSSAWSTVAADAATRLGCDWQGLSWTGARPATGLPAAARQARHALVAEAARETGARVVLFAHTAGDVAETEWMRRHGAPLGRLQEWAPSPVWPEGRDLMLLRPLLDVSRQALRACLLERNATWVDDPANDDPRFLRTRARQATPDDPPAEALNPQVADLSCDEAGTVRGVPTTPWLSQAIACASGRQSVPSRAKVEAARVRLSAGEANATLSGARIDRDGDDIRVTREAGRAGLPSIDLPVGLPRVWDGRYLFRAQEPGWRVAPASGHQAALAEQDRARLRRLPAEARGVQPVLFRDGDPRPVLASPVVEARGLVADRLFLACGGAQREDDLGPRPWRGPDHRPI